MCLIQSKAIARYEPRTVPDIGASGRRDTALSSRTFALHWEGTRYISYQVNFVVVLVLFLLLTLW